jgi:hypothetical protein
MIPIPSYSQITDLLKKGLTLEAQEEIMKLREAALELQGENLQLTQHLREANDKCQKLENDVELKSKISFKNNVCWLEGDSQPICPLCWEGNRKIVHLHGPYRSDGDESYTCRLDEKTFYTRFTPNPSVTMESWDDFSVGRSGLL